MPPGTRDALIDAAEQLLDEGGQRAVTLRAVGARAGVSHNAPYKHFASREALLGAVATRELEAGWAPTADLRTLLQRYVERALGHPQRFQLVYGPWTTELTPELVEAAHAATDALHAAVADAQTAGELPPGDPERLAALLRATAHGAASLSATGHLARDGKGRADASDLVDDLLAHLRDAAAR